MNAECANEGLSQQRGSTKEDLQQFDTQGPPTGCDSPSSVASGRNRENSVPPRVMHLDHTIRSGFLIDSKAEYDLAATRIQAAALRAC